jgi:hypothetical protein
MAGGTNEKRTDKWRHYQNGNQASHA